MTPLLKIDGVNQTFVRNDKSFELANISPEIIKKFSKRLQQIDDRAAVGHASNAQQAHVQRVESQLGPNELPLRNPGGHIPLRCPLYQPTNLMRHMSPSEPRVDQQPERKPQAYRRDDASERQVQTKRQRPFLPQACEGERHR